MNDAMRVVFVGLAGALLAALLIAALGRGAADQGPTRVGAFTTSYDQRLLDDPLELLIVQSDGQAFASLARDPLLRRPEVFRTDAEAAYRAERPLLPYAAWALSLGRTGWVPPALAFLAAAGTGLAAAALARLLIDRGLSAGWGVVVVLLPGTYTSLTYLGPEPLGLGLVAWGLIAWQRKRLLLGAVLFTLAALCRESLLLVPAACALFELRHRRVRNLPQLGAPLLAYLGWITAVRWRVGAWPTDAGDGRLSLPLRGLYDGLAHPLERAWPDNTAFAALCIVVGIVGVVVARRDPLAPIMAAHLAFGSVMGSLIWGSWGGYCRVLLPLHAFATVTIAARLARIRADARVRVASGARLATRQT
ncbi:MAG TPA: hypothetical protein VGQ20_17740 [Acidimicrobiales bacterium]|jgi:hypothetical protein|nr:hypothetical protein [Acidimicrobiales bacterium]